jgi:hypothetical protein
MSATVRPARASDADRLHALQSVLAEPAPALLSAALAATTETPAEHAGDPVVSTADSFVLLVSVTDSGRVVGYVLAIAGRETHIAELVVDADTGDKVAGGPCWTPLSSRGRRLSRFTSPSTTTPRDSSTSRPAS